jgi:actin-related protein
MVEIPNISLDEEPVTYELPDSKIMTIPYSIRSSAPELLFTGCSGDEGVHKMISKLITSSGPDTQKDLASNIILSGGSTLFPNFDIRLKSELESLHPNLDIKITDEHLATQPNIYDFEQATTQKNWFGASSIV